MRRKKEKRWIIRVVRKIPELFGEEPSREIPYTVLGISNCSSSLVSPFNEKFIAQLMAHFGVKLIEELKGKSFTTVGNITDAFIALRKKFPIKKGCKKD